MSHHQRQRRQNEIGVILRLSVVGMLLAAVRSFRCLRVYGCGCVIRFSDLLEQAGRTSCFVMLFAI
jgi:hypothetical protein